MLLLAQLVVYTHFSTDQLKIIAGPYARKLAPQYLQDSKSEDGDLEIEILDEDLDELDFGEYGIDVLAPCLLRARFHSRHSNHKEYFVYVLFDSGKNGVLSIVEFFCTCKCGSRTIEGCVHCFTLIYNICYARFADPNTIPQPGAFLTDAFSEGYPQLL